MNNRRLLATAACLHLVLPVSCRDFNQLFLAEDTPIEACDPTASTYHGYDHFFDRDFLTRDGTLDYRKWFEINRVDASDCDPLRVREREEVGGSGVSPAPSPPSEAPVSPGATGSQPSQAPMAPGGTNPPAASVN